MNKPMSVIRRRNERKPLNQIADTPASEPTATGSVPTAVHRPARVPTHDEVARRAYQLFEERGRAPSREWEDWFRAERELEIGSARERGRT